MQKAHRFSIFSFFLLLHRFIRNSYSLAPIILAVSGVIFTAATWATGLALSAASSTIDGTYSCKLVSEDTGTSEVLNVELRIIKGVVEKFSSSWVLSSNDPDLRPGYTSTCNVDMSKLRQTRRSDDIVLKYEATQQESDLRNCEITISGSQSSIQISSSACTYPCLALELVIEKANGKCQKNGLAGFKVLSAERESGGKLNERA